MKEKTQKGYFNPDGWVTLLKCWIKACAADSASAAAQNHFKSQQPFPTDVSNHFKRQDKFVSAHLRFTFRPVGLFGQPCVTVMSCIFFIFLLLFFPLLSLPEFCCFPPHQRSCEWPVTSQKSCVGLLNNKWCRPSWCSARGGRITTQPTKCRCHLYGSPFSRKEPF